MPSIPLYNQEGQRVGQYELDPAIFDVEPKESLIHQVIVAQLANRRRPIAHTKTRAEVRGGGRKPWRQKGTGRARAGTIRSPLWRGGGVTFGPRKERVFTQKINKKMKKKALFMSLTDKVKNTKFILLDKLSLSEAKTKRMVELLFRPRDLKLKDKSILVVLPGKDENIVRSARNIPRVKTIRADSLNVVDVLGHEYLVTMVRGVERIEEVYKKNKK